MIETIQKEEYPSEGNLITNTQSICPYCLKIVPAKVFESEGKVWIKKTCPKHGEYVDLYWGSYKMYSRASKYAHDGKGVENPNVSFDKPCPLSCGICGMHRSHSALANIVVTNRCDLNCWYCFFYAEKAGYVYEPTIEQIRRMVRVLRSQKPVPGNAVQLSLDYNDEILVKDSNGVVKAVRIGEFVDKVMESGKPVKYQYPTEHERVDVEDWSVLTINDRFKSEFKPIKSVIRHEANGDLYRITTDYGWEITVTGSHSVLVLDGDGSVKPRLVGDLREGDLLLGCLNIPGNENLTRINLIELIKEKTPNLTEKIRVFGFSKRDAVKYEETLGRRIKWHSISLKEYLKSEFKAGKFIKYFNSPKTKRLPIEIEVVPELCRLLGYYVGGGCTYKSGLMFTFNREETDLIDDFLHCVRKILGNVKLRRTEKMGAVYFYIEGYLYKLFFSTLMGAGERATSKKVPWIIFNLPKELKREFLKAYFKCNGNIRARETGYGINLNTVSRDLASDLVLLHLQLGIVAKVEKSNSNHHLIKKTGQFISNPSKKYRVVISGRDQLSKSIWYLDGEISSKFEEYISSEEKRSLVFQRIPLYPSLKEVLLQAVRTEDKHLKKRILSDKSISKQKLALIIDRTSKTNDQLIKNFNEISHSDLGIFRVRRIERVKSSSKYVYDVSVPGSEAFFAGLGPILAHNTGGEPALRGDIVDVIKVIKEEGVDHVQFNTNGLKMAFDPELTKKIRLNGVNTIYLSFDGVTPQTNPKNHWEVPFTLDNCRKAGLGVVLVPTVIRGVNDHEVGDMVRFGAKHIDIIRGVNFQPISLTGRLTRGEVRKYRITIPEVILKIEEQTDGAVPEEAWYPVPTPTPLTHFVEALTRKPQYELTSHFACGMATYIFTDGSRLIPITDFVDVDGLLGYLQEKADELNRGAAKYWVLLKMLYGLRKFIDSSKAPRGFNVTKILYQILVKHDYKALSKLHWKALFLGMMHFMDIYNYDVERVIRCCIHYLSPDGRIIPFCAFNILPSIYRDDIQRKYGLSIEEWEKKTGKSIKSDRYVRNVEKLESSQLYKSTYADFRLKR